MPAATRGRRTRPNTISPGAGVPSSNPSARAAPCSTSERLSGYGPTASALASAATGAPTSSSTTGLRIGSPAAAAALPAGQEAAELHAAHPGLVQQLDEAPGRPPDIPR